MVAVETGTAGVTLLADESVTDDRLTISAAEADAATVVGSQNGARYYRLDCSGVGRINEENLLYFPSVDHARAAGYTPASGCFE